MKIKNFQFKSGKIKVNLDNLNRSRKAIVSVGHPQREQILNEIEEAESRSLSITGIQIAIREDSQPTVSSHIKRLKSFALVEGDKSGKWIYYRVLHDNQMRLERFISELLKDEDNVKGMGYDQATEILRAIDNDKRLEILEFLDKKEKTFVSEIYDRKTGINLQQSQVSTALKILESSGFVTSDKEGKYVFYSINYQRLERVVNLAESYIEYLTKSLSNGRKGNTKRA